VIVLDVTPAVTLFLPVIHRFYDLCHDVWHFPTKMDSSKPTRIWKITYKTQVAVEE